MPWYNQFDSSQTLMRKVKQKNLTPLGNDPGTTNRLIEQKQMLQYKELYFTTTLFASNVTNIIP
jgi:hypothetical protein